MNAFTVYSLGNFLFRRNKVKVADKVLSEKSITKAEVKEYVKEMKEVFSATQFGYMFRISVTKYVQLFLLSCTHGPENNFLNKRLTISQHQTFPCCYMPRRAAKDILEVWAPYSFQQRNEGALFVVPSSYQN